MIRIIIKIAAMMIVAIASGPKPNMRGIGINGNIIMPPEIFPPPRMVAIMINIIPMNIIMKPIVSIFIKPSTA